jgi:hypothetical protein
MSDYLFSIGAYAPVILGGLVIAGVFIGTYFLCQRCDRD